MIFLNQNHEKLIRGATFSPMFELFSVRENHSSPISSKNRDMGHILNQGVCKLFLGYK